MSRHRSIRNAKSYDYDDDDYDYGHSYEDDYCVSPGTMAQYSYPRSIGKGSQFSSFMPLEETVEEYNEEDEEESLKKNETIFKFEEPKKNKTGSLSLFSCTEKIRGTVGENFSKEAIEQAAVECNCDSEKAVDYLLKSPHSVSLSHLNGNTVSKQDNSSKVIASDGIAMPQRTTARGRRAKTTQKNSPVLLVTTQSPKSNSLSTATTDPKVKRVETNSQTPVKTGFHITTNCNNPKSNSTPARELRRFSEPVLPKSEVESLTTSKKTDGPLLLNKKINVANDDTPASTPSKQGKSLVDFKKEYQNRTENEKQQISMVVIGHVDAGKSTMMGHLLFQKGVVSKRVIHKYEQESKKLGKASFAYAWVLDETGEERARGVTMDVAHNYFETDNRIVTLMDAPGHRDFIPNMITGASQADVAVLVVGSSTGEFEAGFGVGGQTREHALLVRSLGVSQLAVAVNKLDSVAWSKQRFDEIVSKLKQFLKQAGFRDSDVTYVPVSGLLGENLMTDSKEPLLRSWYKGPCLLKVIDKFRSPPRPVDYAFRFCVNDVFRGQGSGIYLSGKVESGGVSPNMKVMVMPAGEKGLVKGLEASDGNGRLDFALAGEHTTIILNGVDVNKINKGSVVCDVDNPIRAVTRLQARIIVFNIEVPITKGFPVELHYKAVSEPAVIKRLLSQLNKSTGEVMVKKPRFILKNHNALVEIEIARQVCLEEYSNLKELGRFTLRYGGSTIAACIVTKLL